MLTSDTSPETTPRLDQQAREVVGKPRAVDTRLSVNVCRINGRNLRLTRQQMSIAKLVAEGLPDKVIARRTGITTNTVQGYLHRMLGMNSCGSRTELVGMLTAAVLQRHGLTLAGELDKMFQEAVA